MYRQIHRNCPYRWTPSLNGGFAARIDQHTAPKTVINIQPPIMGSASKIHQPKGVRLQEQFLGPWTQIMTKLYFCGAMKLVMKPRTYLSHNISYFQALSIGIIVNIFLYLFLSECFHAIQSICLDPTQILFKEPQEKSLPP